MDWAIVTWGILIGMVGLLWVMALAVIYVDDQERGSEPPPGRAQESEAGIEVAHGHERRSAA